MEGLISSRIIAVVVATVVIVIAVSEIVEALHSGPMAAFINSLIVLAAFTLIVVLYAPLRPVGTPLTWGEAMVAATFAFMFFTVGYGIVPDLWIKLGGELGWDDPGRLLADDAPGPLSFVAGLLPFDTNYIHIRDLIVIAIYGLVIVGNIWIWHFWQSRGREKTAVEPVSDFGRPLVREGAR